MPHPLAMRAFQCIKQLAHDIKHIGLWQVGGGFQNF